jgi:hypothetical protein
MPPQEQQEQQKQVVPDQFRVLQRTFKSKVKQQPPVYPNWRSSSILAVRGYAG